MKSKNIFIKNTILLLIFICFGIVFCKKAITNQSTLGFQNSNSVRKGKLVIAEGGLNVRENPALDAKAAFLLPNYSFLDEFEEVGEEIEVKDKKGKWTKISYEGNTGYVFGGYLTNSTLDYSEANPTNTYYYIFFSTPEYGANEPTDCTSNYMQAGCLVVVYKTSNKQPINAFTNTVVNGWIDKDHLATSWSIGDAGYGGEGIRSNNIHTKEEIDIWRRDSQAKIVEDDGAEETDKLCLKKFCYDLKKNPNVISQIKATRGLKFYEQGQYSGSANEYSTEIQIGTNETIIFFPGKNIVLSK
jgi:hypothetical protein